MYLGIKDTGISVLTPRNTSLIGIKDTGLSVLTSRNTSLIGIKGTAGLISVNKPLC